MSAPERAREIVEKIDGFVADVVIPEEVRLGGRIHDAPEELRFSLQQQARDAGVFGPTFSMALGGLGLSHLEQAAALESAGYSLLGPMALNCAAPDEGNIHLLDVVAQGLQRTKYLEPLARGEVRSCFAMTEPSPGAGSDPRALRTVATERDGGWIIDGEKWFTTGAVGASFVICMARTEGSVGDPGGATMFLVDLESAGVEIVRQIGTLDEGMLGGHAQVRFSECAVGSDAVLGEVGRGFDYAQVRLAPARLTHCMRWLGVARRALDQALAYAVAREVFGSQLVELGMAQQMIADAVIDLEASRALIASAARALDEGADPGPPTSIAKVFVSEAVGRVVDRSVQLCGATGVSEDLLLSRYYREVRAFRIYDGPSEVHRWSIARREANRARSKLSAAR